MVTAEEEEASRSKALDDILDAARIAEVEASLFLGDADELAAKMRRRTRTSC